MRSVVVEKGLVRRPVAVEKRWPEALQNARDGSHSTISFHVADKSVLTMTITREGGELRLN
jgi:hypothetical protein